MYTASGLALIQLVAVVRALVGPQAGAMAFADLLDVKVVFLVLVLPQRQFLFRCSVFQGNDPNFSNNIFNTSYS